MRFVSGGKMGFTYIEVQNVFCNDFPGRKLLILWPLPRGFTY